MKNKLYLCIMKKLLIAFIFCSCTHKSQYVVVPQYTPPTVGVVFVIDTNLETKINNTFILKNGIAEKFGGDGWLVPVNQCEWQNIEKSLYKSKVLYISDSPTISTLNNSHISKEIYIEYYNGKKI